jgi:hypothetical protein
MNLAVKERTILLLGDTAFQKKKIWMAFAGHTLAAASSQACLLGR